MEYLDGMTFEEFLGKRGGKVNFETALRIMVPVMDTLAVVHGEGILHRDISPDNIHLGKNGKVKLMDFGAARNALSQKSRNLSVILKEGYAPEEQYRSSGIQGPWTDVYATAATLYHSLTGKLPPPALDRAAEDDIENPSKLGVALPPGSERALMKALAVRAMDRYQSMEDFKAGLVENVNLPPPMPAAQQAAATQPPPLAQQSQAGPPPLAPNPPPVSNHPASNHPPTPQFQSPPPQTYLPPMQESFSVPPTSKGSSRKWLIPVVVIAVFALAAGAAVTLRYGSDLFSKSSNDRTAATPGPEQQAASGASQTDEDRQRQLAQKAPPGADAPTATDGASQPPAQNPESKPAAQPPAAKPAPPPTGTRPADPPPVPEPAPMNPPAPAVKPQVRPAPPANTNSGVLRYAGPPVPFNGSVTFANLPGARLRFTFDHAAWQPIISRQPDGSQTLVLVSLKHDLQSKCEVQWEKVE
jgi:serine/threonine protein kinase